MEKRIFERSDPVTGDGIRVDRDGDRLRFRFHVEDRAAVLILADPRDGARLARALADAFAEEFSHG